MKSSIIRSGTLAGIALLALCHGSFARAAASGCEPVFQAMTRLIETSSHQTLTMTAAFNGGKPRNSEVIITGGNMYVSVAGKWIHVPRSTQDLKQEMITKMQTANPVCTHLRDEAIAGESAAVYEIKENTEGDSVNTQIWISTQRGLPLRQDIDIDVGGSMGKSHTTSHFDYSNVQAPAGTS